MTDSLTRVACVQFSPQFGQVEHNRALADQLIRDAARNGAQVIVLPELSNSGYVFNSPDEVQASAESINSSLTLQRWLTTAGELSVYVAAGFCERSGDSFYNSACLLTPAGDIHLYRKNHLYYEETLYFEPGDLGFPVFDLPFGRAGLLICYDSSFPESYQVLAHKRAQLVLLPTNWGASRGLSRSELLAPVQMNCIVAARSYGMFVAAANRTGLERGRIFRGGSLIVEAGGQVLAGPTDAQDQILYADIDLSNMERYYQTTRYNHVWKDRRPDLYQQEKEGLSPAGG